jgi:hypothetical protein
MRRALAAAAVLALVLTGCAETDEPAVSSGAASSEPAAGSSDPAESDPAESEPAEAIEIEIEGDRIEPNGLRVQVGAGETVTLSVTSDRAAEFHVHSSPEQVVEVAPGESTKTLVIERPGLVDVEEHESGLVVLQLEVR